MDKTDAADLVAHYAPLIEYALAREAPGTTAAQVHAVLRNERALRTIANLGRYPSREQILRVIEAEDVLAALRGRGGLHP